MRPNPRPDAPMTREEFKKLKKSMKDEKFHELLGDYMKEISDPKNVAEYDKYLEQLKSEGELPEGMELIRPDPEFVIKSTLASKNDRKFTQNIYVNICSHAVVVKPTLVEMQGGKQWQVPYLVGKIRYDQDESESVVNTVDVVFNKESTDLAQKHPEYHRVLCDTAIEAAQAALIERKEIINKDYTVMPKMKCKGDMPALLPVTLDEAAKERAKLARNKPPGGKIFNEIQDLKDAAKKDAKVAGSGAENEETMMEPAARDEEEEEEVNPEKSDADHDFSKGPIAPKYSVVYSYPTAIGDFRNQSNIAEPSTKEYVSHIKLTINLPLVESVEDLKVDIKQRSLELEYKGIYYLSLNFLYDVIVDDAKAKFVSTSKTLVLTLPVVKRSLPEPKVVRPAVFEPTEDADDDNQDEQAVEEAKQTGESTNTNEEKDETHKGSEKLESQVEEIGSTDNASLQKEATPVTESLESTIEETNQAGGQKLEIEIMLKPQITFLEKLHIYLLYLPGYLPSQIDLLTGDDKLLVQYRGEHVTKYCLVTAEGRSSFKSVEVEKQCAKDYFGFRLQFRSKDDSDVAKECFKVQTETTDSECEVIFQELTEERLRREEIQKKAQESLLQEIHIDTETTENDTQGNIQVDTAGEADQKEPGLAGNEVTIVASPDQQDVPEDTQGEGSTPQADEAAARRANKYGWQLLDLEAMDIACQLD